MSQPCQARSTKQKLGFRLGEISQNSRFICEACKHLHKRRTGLVRWDGMGWIKMRMCPRKRFDAITSKSKWHWRLWKQNSMPSWYLLFNFVFKHHIHIQRLLIQGWPCKAGGIFCHKDVGKKHRLGKPACLTRPACLLCKRLHEMEPWILCWAHILLPQTLRLNHEFDSSPDQ